MEGSLVWERDLIKGLKQDKISDFIIAKIIKNIPNKKSILLPNKKTVNLVDYNEFIKVLEAITKRKVTDCVRDVNNFRKYMNIQMVNKKKVAMENIQEMVVPKVEVKEYKKEIEDVVFDYWEVKTPSYLPTEKDVLEQMAILENNFDKKECSNLKNIKYLDEKSKKLQDKVLVKKHLFPVIKPLLSVKAYKESMIKIREKEDIIEDYWEVKENPGFLASLLEETAELNAQFDSLPMENVVVGTYYKWEFNRNKVSDDVLILNDKVIFPTLRKYINDFVKKVISFLYADIEEEVENICVYENIKNCRNNIHQIQNSLNEALNKKDIMNFEIPILKNDIRYKVFNMCEKIGMTKDEMLVDFIIESKEYLDILSKKDKNKLEYEKELALLVTNKIYNALNMNNLKEVRRYANYYLDNMKENFKEKEIVFRNKTKMAFRLGIGTLMSFISLDILAYNMIGINKKINKRIEVEYTDFKKEETNINKVKSMNNVLNEFGSSKTVKVKELLPIDEDIKEYISIGEEILIEDGSRLYETVDDVVNNKTIKPYYDNDADIDRTVSAVILGNEQKTVRALTDEEIDSYMDDDYKVLAYQVDNIYSFDEENNHLNTEGIYKAECLKLKKVKK